MELLHIGKTKFKKHNFLTPRQQKKKVGAIEHQRYHQQLQHLYNKPMVYDSNISNNDGEIETEEIMNKSILHSTNPFRHDINNDGFANESLFSKHRDSRYNNNEPSYISQFNEGEMYLAVGENNPPAKTHDEQMEELREYFKKKIVNAYNSIYLDSADPRNDSTQYLTQAEKMIRKIILKEKNKLKQKGQMQNKEKLRIRINAKKIMKELMGEKMTSDVPLEQILGEARQYKRTQKGPKRKLEGVS